MSRTLIGVIGGSDVTDDIAADAEKIGAAIARAGAIVVTGGAGGVMEAACKGAKSEGGTTIGILPGTDAREANAYVDIPIVTGMNQARNVIIARTAHALIALDGSFGTLSEIAFGLHFDKPVIGLGTWKLSSASGRNHVKDPLLRAQSPADAVALALDAAIK